MKCTKGIVDKHVRKMDEIAAYFRNEFEFRDFQKAEFDKPAGSNQ